MKHKMITSRRKAVRLRLFALGVFILALFGSLSIPTAPEPHSRRPYPDLSDTSQLVQVYEGEVEWTRKPLHSVPDNTEFIAGGYLCRKRSKGMADLAPLVDIARLPEADRTFEIDNWRFPLTNDVVRVLDPDGRHDSHKRLDCVPQGSQFVFQGRRYKLETGDQPGLAQIVDTGLTLSRVARTFKSKADTLLDLTIRNESGSNSVISCTTEHPFYVPAQSAYIAAQDLKPDTVFQTANQKLSTLASVAVRHGDFEVFNFEVEGTHNYFVGKDQILVHNTSKLIPGNYSAAKTPATVDRIRNVAQQGYDYAVQNPRVQGLNRMQLGKDAEVQATRWMRRWAERNDVDLGPGGFNSRCAGRTQFPMSSLTPLDKSSTSS